MSDLRFPAVETERLIVRPFTAEDAERRFALMREAFDVDWPPDQLARWHGWTLASYEAFAAMWQPPYGDYAVALKETGELIGSVGIVPALVPWAALDSANPTNTFVQPEFGLFWALFSAHRGHGYATEAARPVIAFLWETMWVRRIVAATDFDNPASQSVMRKLGMTLRRNAGGQPPWCEVVGVLER
ncbi:MAG TPA: GNAT family N-acetyltransferase [Candidatus Limnocylindrales bacterium]|nr:GNAT family N-acetyltransferase [Candidatus Limnocylindrales bacterium]